MATSPAQQNYRDFKKEVNTMRHYVEEALKSGESYDRNLVVSFFSPLLQDYTEVVLSEGFDIERWYSRGVEFILQSVAIIEARYVIKEEEGEAEKQEVSPQDTGDTVLGFPVIDYDDCIQDGARVRGQILLTIEELAEYLQPIPFSVIRGIVLAYDEDGQFTGFQLCGNKNT